MPAPKAISFRPEERLEAQLNARATTLSTGTATRQSLERYFYALEYALRELRGTFTLIEMTAIADAASGTYWEAHSASFLSEQISDAIRLDDLATHHGLDAEALTRKTSSLTQIQSLAIIDALERWRGGGGEPTQQGFAAIGLQVTP